MAIIPIKVLKDKNQEAFLPFTITDAVFVPDTNKTITNALEEQDERIDEAIESVPTKTSDLENDSGFITNADVPTKTSDLTNDSDFVSDANYVHTDSNYTDNEKSKLAGITAGAEVNVLEKVKVNGTEQTITNKAVDITVPTKVSDIDNDLSFINNTVNNLVNYYTKTEVDNKVSSVYKYQGSVNTYADLPSSGQVIGDVYNVVTADTTHGIPAGGNVAWNGTTWDYLGGDVDFSNYYTKTQVDTSLNGKVDKITGKQLSTEDYTSAEKTKLSNIEANAAVNLIESISVNNTTVSPVNKNVNITIPTTLAALTSDALHRTVADTDIDNWNAKQDELVSSVNIRTINGTSILGSGNIDTSGGGGTWGTIGGTLSDQTDLQTALDAKQNKLTLPLKYMEYIEDEEDYSAYYNYVINTESDPGTGIPSGVYEVDTSICTQPYPEGIMLMFGHGSGSSNQYMYTLKQSDVLIIKHASDVSYSVGDAITVISSDGSFITTKVKSVNAGTTTLETITLENKEAIHHITSDLNQNRHMFVQDINICDVAITQECYIDGGSVQDYTFPAGTLCFCKYGDVSNNKPGLIITPTGVVFKVTALATLTITMSTIKPYVDLTSNQTIGGVKTFSSVPVCATQPTSNDELANKAYVDSQASGTVITGNINTSVTNAYLTPEQFTGKYYIDTDGLKYPVYSQMWYIPKTCTPIINSMGTDYAYCTGTRKTAHDASSSPPAINAKRVFYNLDYSRYIDTSNYIKPLLNSVTGLINASGDTSYPYIYVALNTAQYNAMSSIQVCIEFTKTGEGVTP